MGCPLVQGYYLARPMTTEALTALLRRQSEQESPEFNLCDLQLDTRPQLPAHYEDVQSEYDSGSVRLPVV
jgi:hypothetical protein